MVYYRRLTLWSYCCNNSLLVYNYSLYYLIKYFNFNVCRYAHGNAKPGDKQSLKGFGIVFTIISIVLVVMLICLFKRIKMVIRLFDEAIKVIFAIPLILIEPVLVST